MTARQNERDFQLETINAKLDKVLAELETFRELATGIVEQFESMTSGGLGALLGLGGPAHTSRT